MSYLNSTTFLIEANSGVLTVTFNQPPINIQSNKQLDELDKLADKLEGDRTIKVVVFSPMYLSSLISAKFKFYAIYAL